MRRRDDEPTESHRPARAATVVLCVAAALFLCVSVVAVRGWMDARDRSRATRDNLSDLTATAEASATNVGAARQARTDAEDRAGPLMALFTPEAIEATIQFQDQAAASGCEAARAATRDGTSLTTGVQAVGYAVATTGPALDGLPDQWSQLIDPAAVQAEIDRCADDEAAVIEAERQAAAAEAAAEAASTPDLNTCEGFLAAVRSAGRPPTSGESQYLYIECGIDYRG